MKHPRRNHSNQYAVLGALNENGPMTSFELVQYLGWGSWKSGRIYVILRQLENAKKITCEWVEENGRSKRLYMIARAT